MDNNFGKEDNAEKVVGELQKGFVVVGVHRIRPWYTLISIGITVGVIAGAIYVSNRSGQFSASKAAIEEGEVINAPADSKIGMLINEYAAAEPLSNIRIERASGLRTEGDADVLTFGEPEYYPLLVTDDWSVFNSVLDTLIFDPNPFELTLNPGQLTELPYLVYGPNIAQTYALYLDAGGSKNPPTEQPPKKCACDKSVSYLIVCQPGDTAHYIHYDPSKNPPYQVVFAKLEASTFTDSKFEKTKVCTTDADCSGDKACTDPLPNPNWTKIFGPHAAIAAAVCKATDASVSPGSRNGKCQTSTSAK